MAPGVARHVALHPRLKPRRAQPLLKHRQHHLAFFVGDAVPDGGQLIGVAHRLGNAAGRRQPVGTHRLLARLLHGGVPAPAGLQLGGDAVAQPGRKRFIQPDVVPPGRCHQVAKPLVCQLMRGGGHVVALELRRLRGRGGQQQGGRVGDETGVFHRAKVDGDGDGQAVELGIRVRQAEIRLQPLDDGAGDAGGVGRIRRAATRRDDAHRRVAGLGRRPAGGAGVQHLKIAHGKGQQVAGQRRRGRKVHSLPAGLGGLFAGDRHVGHGQQGLRHGQGQRPRHLPARLVKQRKGQPGAGGFKLGDRHPLAAVLLAEQAVHILVLQLAGKADRQPRRAGRHGLAKLQRNAVGVQPLHLAGQAARAHVQRHLLDLQVFGMQAQAAGGLAQLQVDLHRAAVLGLIGVDHQRQAVGQRLHIGCKPIGGAGAAAAALVGLRVGLAFLAACRAGGVARGVAGALAACVAAWAAACVAAWVAARAAAWVAVCATAVSGLASSATSPNIPQTARDGDRKNKP